MTKIIFSIFLFLSLVFFSLFIRETFNGPSPEAVESVATPLQNKAIHQPSPSMKTTSKKQQQAAAKPTPTSSIKSFSSPIPTTQPQPKTDSPQSPQISPAPIPSLKSETVNLSITGGGSFDVLINNGENQCDVLTDALIQGKLTSLDMRYNESYSSYAVYQINNLGQSSQVWWTYSVNGKNPPVGCSQVKAQNNDDVSWSYIGPN